MNEKPCATLRGNVVTIHEGGLYEFAGIAEGKPATVAVVSQSATGASTRVGEGQPLNRQALEGLSMVDRLRVRSLESPKHLGNLFVNKKQEKLWLMEGSSRSEKKEAREW